MKFSINIDCDAVACHIYYHQNPTKYIFGHIAKKSFSKNWIGGAMVRKWIAVYNMSLFLG